MVTSTFVSSKPDPWRATGCILTPTVDAVMSQVPVVPPVPMFTPANTQHHFLNLLTPTLYTLMGSGASTALLVLTVVHQRLVILVGTNLCATAGVDRVVETNLVQYADANLDFHAAYRYLAAGNESCPLHVFMACCFDVLVGSASYPPVPPSGTGVTVHAKLHVQVRVRAWTPPVSGVVLVVDARGVAVKCVPAFLSPLFQHVYVAVTYDSVDMWQELTEEAGAEVTDVVRALEAMSATGFGGVTLPPLALLSDADVPSHVLSLYDPPSLFPHGVTALQHLVNSVTLNQWFEHMELRAGTMSAPVLVCTGYWMAKSRHLTLGVNHATTSAQQVQVWRDMLTQRPVLTGEMEGLVFDVCMQGHTVETLPPYFHPGTFCDDPQGAGYLTMLYLLQWRQTLKRFVEVAHERVHELPGAADVLPSLAMFRVGVLVQAPGVRRCKSTHRVLPGNQHSFFINLSGHDVLNMHVKSTLQQQRAEDRNVVVAYFMGQALDLLGGVLCPGDGKRAVSVLTEGYFAALKPKSMLNLAKLYERMQGMARKFRQEVCALKQVQQGRSKGKRKSDE